MDSESIDHPCKRARLDSAQDATTSLFTYVDKNKPVGIALPQILQKVETRENEAPSKNDLLKIGEPVDVKSFHLSLEESTGRKEKEKMELVSSAPGSYDEKSTQMSKPFLDSGFGENSGTDIASSLEYCFGPPSDDGSDDSGDDEIAMDNVKWKHKLGEGPGGGLEGGGGKSEVHDAKVANTQASSGKDKGEILITMYHLFARKSLMSLFM